MTIHDDGYLLLAPRTPLSHLNAENSKDSLDFTLDRNGSFNADRTTAADLLTYCKYDIPATRHREVAVEDIFYVR